MRVKTGEVCCLCPDTDDVGSSVQDPVAQWPNSILIIVTIRPFDHSTNYRMTPSGNFATICDDKYSGRPSNLQTNIHTYTALARSFNRHSTLVKTWSHWALGTKSFPKETRHAIAFVIGYKIDFICMIIGKMRWKNKKVECPDCVKAHHLSEPDNWPIDWLKR